MNKTECYAILELAPGASADQIKKAYRELCIIWHPDRFPNNPELRDKAHERTKKINEAYKSLTFSLVDWKPPDNKPSHPAASERSRYWQVVAAVGVVLFIVLVLIGVRNTIRPTPIKDLVKASDVPTRFNWKNRPQGRTERALKKNESNSALLVGKRAGEVRDDNSLKLKLVWCPPGKFKMGEAATAVDITLTKGVWLGQTEVTQAQWQRVIHTIPWKWAARYEQEARKRLEEEERKPLNERGFLHFRSEILSAKEGENYPAMVSQVEALEFCNKLTESERLSGRLPADWKYTLPTEAQWEYACRAGSTTRFSFGNDESNLAEFGWYDKNSKYVDEGYAHEVGLKKANSWGLFDMHGNVSEWCLERYGNDGAVTVATNIFSPSRVLRGGGFCDSAKRCQVTSRGGIPQDMCLFGIGFRVALSPPPAPQELPSNGDLHRYLEAEAIAPLQIRTKSDGYHYFVKLCDCKSGSSVATVFIRGGMSAEIKMPLGTYCIKYAAGKDWYGEYDLLGKSASYHKANKQFTFDQQDEKILGHTIELIPQVLGNLKTEEIKPSEW